MSAEELRKFLVECRCCKNGLAWASGRTLREAWQQCDYAEWLMWAAANLLGHPEWFSLQQVVLAACALAETTFRCEPYGLTTLRTSLDTIRKWARGDASYEQVKIARSAASDVTFEAIARGLPVATDDFAVYHVGSLVFFPKFAPVVAAAVAQVAAAPGTLPSPGRLPSRTIPKKKSALAYWQPELATLTREALPPVCQGQIEEDKR